MPVTQKAFTSGSECPKLEPGTLRLYSMRLCPYAQRSRLVLAHKQIDYETVNINLKQKPEWYLADINPLGLVPALQRDDKIVYESSVVCDYLDEVYPENKLTPSDLYQRSKDRMLMERWSKVAGLFYKTAMANDPEAIKAALTELWSALAVFEIELKNRNTPFFGGDSVMMIDYLVWPHLERIDVLRELRPEFSMDAEKFPLLTGYIERMKSTAAVKETITSPALYKQMFVSAKQGKMDYDLGLEE